MNTNNHYEAPRFIVKDAAYHRARAREALRGNLPIAILITLVAALLGATGSGGIIFNFNYDLPSDTIQGFDGTFASFKQILSDLMSLPMVSFFITFAIILSVLSLARAIFLAAPTKIGYQRFQLALIDKDTAALSFETLFMAFRRGYLKSVCLQLVLLLIGLIPAIPAVIFVVCSFVLLSVLNFGLLSALAILFLSLITAAISLALSIYVTYAYAFAPMILSEYPEIGITEALRNSRHLMRGNKWKYFCLQISFIGWILLAVFCTCGLGTIILSPYMGAASASFYDTIANRDAAKEAVFPSLDPDDYQN